MTALALVEDRRAGGEPEARVEAMLRHMRARGPDGRALRSLPGLALGHCLLRVTPEDTRLHTTVHSRDERLHLVADARLDNRDDLVAGLRAAPGASDAELILAAYERWGEDCARRLLGDFAFVLWDAGRRQICAVRDHFGVRPLFYRHDARGLAFASDMQALLADATAPLSVRPLAIARYLIEQYGEDGDTLYEGVQAVPPASTLVARGGEVTVRPYWRPDPWRREPSRSDEGHAARFRDAFEQAVRCRLRARGPMAVTVSGGLDSSSVAGAAAALDATPTVTHLAFPGLACDEGRYSAAVASRWSLPTLDCRPLDEPGLCRPEVGTTHPDLYFHPTARMYLPMARALRERALRSTVSGIFGDLLLTATGVEWADALRAGRVGPVLRESAVLRRPLTAAAWQGLWHEGLRQLIPDRVRAAVAPLRRPRRPEPAWLQAPLAAQLEEHVAEARRAHRARGYPDQVTEQLCRYVEHPYTRLVLSVFARLFAVHGLDLRHPFLDVRLVELMLALPHEQRTVVGRDKPKPILRRAMAHVLPPEVLQRSDSAEYSCYIESALLGRNGSALRALFARSRLVDAGILEPNAARAIGQGRGAMGLVPLVNLTAMELWLREIGA